MTKLLRQLAAIAYCAALSTAFTACSDDDGNPNPGPDPVVIPEFTSEWTAEGYYKADYYDTNSGNVFVGLTSTSLVYDSDEDDYTGNGQIIVIDLNTILAENPDYATIATGDYVTSDTPAEGTINLDSESYITFYSGSNSHMYDVTEGYVTVTHYEGNIYSIRGELTTEDGTTTEVNFVGRIPIYNRTDEGYMSNLRGNVEVTGLSQGAALYGGSIFTASSDYYMVMIADKDFDLDYGYGDGRAIYLGINVTPGADTGIPSGTYTVIDADGMDTAAPGTALSGFYMPYYGGFYGAWYFHVADGIEAAAQTGTITFDNKGNDRYSITFDLKDGYGHTITGTYNGTLDLYDAS